MSVKCLSCESEDLRSNLRIEVIKKKKRPCVLMRTLNLNTEEAESGRFLGITGQPTLPNSLTSKSGKDLYQKKR